MRRAAHIRGGWFGVVPGAAAASLLATLSFASLCLCSDEHILLQPFAEGCGLAAQRHVEFAPSVEGAGGDACLGPCVDVRVLAAGAPGDERAPVAAPGLVAASPWPVSDRPHLSPLRASFRESRPTAGHLDYTILRC